MTQGVALAHDYATQRGGAERVALLLAEAFPGSPMYTTLYDPDGTFPEFGALDLRTSALDRSRLLRRHHRAALPFLAPAVDRQRVDADVLLASSTGWAHGYRGARRTVVYCHAPARWLYQRDRYLGPAEGSAAHRARRRAAAAALGLLSPGLRRWDGAAARRADVYLANSTVTQRAIREAYGIEAEVLAPPPAMLPAGEERPLPGVEPGFLLCVARLLPYKNVDVVVAAAQATGRELVVVGDGPDRARLEAQAAQRGRVHLLGRVDDATLRWVYRHASALVAASYEDYGLSPLEAGAFGRPSVVLRDGGYLDTVADGVTGVFFDAPRADLVADAVEDALSRSWDDDAVAAHVATFGRERFVERLRGVVAEQQQDRTLSAGRPGGGRAQE
ncbi:glycosyltransferase [Cellulosimicrobium composti]|uniref:D-inositol 3-phosphate glycosyltransferase n=1 Tax=Cellulosimicrobium composti TaxID=2672572 RepID=A0A6N7ZDF1_9MICO|nr:MULTISPECIES: glycosyltransferase [Cellulosimicrobium]MTG87352.1 glycosyltransferase [Cellulosimicrobium composti]NDO89124.1 glycosyltransferase family 4 protein [Cellulosimicrobium composti]TWG85539.1 glycosyltransferase involved in cell wall biosynthesis [Cellulosimicrobium cellulans J34]SMF26262.1 Glycosyltransferase involved in cell wall bisynthesis [Cellulosimicrobium cellulans J1]